MIKYEKEFANLPDYLPDCAGCTDPNSEGTHSATTKQHWEEVYIKPLLLRQIDEDNKRFLGYVGEDEVIDRNLHLDWQMRCFERNVFRAELRDKVNKK